VNGPHLLTRDALRRLPNKVQADPAAGDHDLDLEDLGSSLPDLTAKSDGELTIGPVVRGWRPTGNKTQDPQIAVSASHVVVATWDHWTVYTKDGTQLMAVTARNFFAGLIPEINASLNVPDLARYGIDHFFDTRLIYDDYRHRFWLVTMAKQKETDAGINRDATNADLTYRRAKILVGVSATDDPTGDWYRYWWDGVIDDGICNEPLQPVQSFQCPGSSFHPGDGHDFAYIGISKFHFMQTNVTTNYIFLAAVAADDLAGGQIPAGGFAAWQYGEIEYPDDGARVTGSLLQPAVHHGPASPGGSWLLNLRREPEPPEKVGKVYLWFLSGGTATTPPFLGSAPLPFSVGRMSVADQAGHPNLTPRRLKAFPGQYVMKAVWRDGDLYAVIPDCRQWSGASECMAAIKLLRFPAFGETGRPTINGTFGMRNVHSDPPGTLFSYFLPSLEVNRLGDMAIVYQRSGSTIWPEVRVSVRHSADASVRPSMPVRFGEFPVGCDLADFLCAGQELGETPDPAGSIDNAGMAVDPFDDEAIWMVHGYGSPQGDPATTTTGKWQLAVGKVFGRPHPDLAFRSIVSGSRSLAIGSLFEAVLTVHNQGDGPSEEAAVAIFLTSSADPSRPPERIAEGRVRSIRSGGRATARVEGSIPVWLAPGEYLLFATVDHDGKVREYNESNNTSEGVLLQVTSRNAP
jgi:hypothetical protein